MDLEEPGIFLLFHKQRGIAEGLASIHVGLQDLTPIATMANNGTTSGWSDDDMIHRLKNRQDRVIPKEKSSEC